MPKVLDQVPGGQGRQVVMDTAGTLWSEYFPEGQSVQIGAPTSAHVPSAHSKHLSMLPALSKVLNFPASQSVHTDDSSLDHLPGIHVSQMVFFNPVAKVPASQIVHSVEEEAFEKRPSKQTAHSVMAPEFGSKVPASQSMQSYVAAIELDHFPGMHSLQVASVSAATSADHFPAWQLVQSTAACAKV
jgi:hypothetical protein